MSYDFRMPSITGSDREQLAQIRSYLYQFIPQLQWALNNINTTPSKSLDSGEVLDYKEGLDTLKHRIIKFADIKITKKLNAQGWYKVGVLSGEMCAVATLTIGGALVNNQVSPSMVDIATQPDQARMLLRLPSLEDGQISKIGVVRESNKAYGVYAYYNTANENTVDINIHIHMGAFASSDLAVASVTDSNMLSSINVKQ